MFKYPAVRSPYFDEKPPVDKVGVFDLETFYPAKERLGLAMALNNLVAAPGFGVWLQGEPLDVQRLLYTDQGKPRISIVSIAHLNDAERMFVVTLLLGEIVAWMRRQSGTSSLRALLYMDEIFGYFPPTAMPPSKQPLLTLMKQARAFGLGVVLATQNPVDLDYKGLSNAGTWFIGRLQTERDKARVIEGLLSSAGEGLDKSTLDALLVNLGNRVFLMRNVHDDAPVLFRTRWALSYLRGPMTLQEIARLGRTETATAPAAPAPTLVAAQASPPPSTSRPVIPPGITEYYTTATRTPPRYVARVLGIARVHFVDKTAGIDAWETRSYVAPLTDDETQPDWRAADEGGDPTPQLAREGVEGATYQDVPAILLRAQNYAAWRQRLEAHVNETATLAVLRSAAAGAASSAASENEFRARLALTLREKRDAAIDQLRRKYAPRLATLEDQLRRAEDRIERESSQLSQQKMQTAISIGTSILGAFLGRRRVSVTNVGRVGSAARSAGRIGRESEDVSRAQESLEVLAQRKTDLENELQQEVSRLQGQFDPAASPIERTELRPRKSDIDVTTVALLWLAT